MSTTNTPTREPRARRQSVTIVTGGECSCGCEIEPGTNRDELIADGWVRARGTWTCPDCVDEYRTEQQAHYDATTPAPLHDPMAVER